MRVTTSDNGITNAIEIYHTLQGQVRGREGVCHCPGSATRHGTQTRLLLLSPARRQQGCSAVHTSAALPLLQVRVLCSNNDDMVRAFDAQTFQLVRCVGKGSRHAAGSARMRLPRCACRVSGHPCCSYSTAGLNSPCPRPRPLSRSLQPAALALGRQLHCGAAGQLPPAADGGR